MDFFRNHWPKIVGTFDVSEQISNSEKKIDAQQTAIRNEQVLAKFDATKTILLQEQPSIDSVEIFADGLISYTWPRDHDAEDSPNCSSSEGSLHDQGADLETRMNNWTDEDTVALQNSFRWNPSRLGHMASNFFNSMLAATEDPTEADFSQRASSEILNSIESAALAQSFSKEIHQGLVKQAACNHRTNEDGNSKPHHVAMLRMRPHEQSKLRHQSYIDTFCGFSHQPQELHRLRGLFNNSASIETGPEPNEAFHDEPWPSSSDCVLCSVWSKCWSEGSDYQFVFRKTIHGSSQVHEHGINTLESVEREPVPTLSLKALLESHSSGQPNDIFVSDRMKAEIRLSLAVAMYEIPSKTWLPREWKSESIFFQNQSKGRSLSSNILHPGDPFILTPLTARSEEPGIDAISMLSFALVLLEIETGYHVYMPPVRDDFSYILAVSREIGRLKTSDQRKRNLLRAVEECMHFREQASRQSEEPMASNESEKALLLNKIIRPLIQDTLDYCEPVDERNLTTYDQDQDFQGYAFRANRSDRHFDGRSVGQCRSIKGAPRERKVHFDESEDDGSYGSGISVIENQVAAALSDWTEQESKPSDEGLCFEAGEYLQRMKAFNNVMEISCNGVERNATWPKQQVRVAIIDSGLETGAERASRKAQDPLIRAARKSGRIIGERSWVGRDCTDECGHGTRVARQFLGVAPCADLVVAKVTRDMRIPENELHHISEAIDWAIEKYDVDIISLSLGLTEKSRDLDDKLDEILNLDSSRGRRRRVVLAAASNYGGNREITYPASKHGVICVHASDGFGNRGSFNPGSDRKQANFSALGVYIPFELRAPKKTIYISGTSYATPIAAGLAANVLHFARANLGLAEEDLSILHSYYGVREVLLQLSSVHGDFDFLCPWRNRNHRASEREDSTWHTIRRVVLASIAVAKSEVQLRE